MSTFATVREAHDCAMMCIDRVIYSSASDEQRHYVDALTAETEAVRLAFERDTSPETRYVLLRSLINTATTMADRVLPRVLDEEY